MEIYFSEIQVMYISIFNSKFLTGGGTTSSLFYSVCAGEKSWRR